MADINPNQAQIDKFEHFQSFLLEALDLLLVGSELDIDLRNYDLDNPHDVGRAQTDQATIVQLLEGLGARVVAESSDFKLLKYTVEALRKDYLVNYSLANPKPHGFSRELYDHNANNEFMKDEGFDLKLLFELELRFEQLSFQLNSRQERISALYHQLREKQKSNALVLVQRPSGMSVLVPSQADAFPEVGRTPMPKSRMIPTSPIVPAPAAAPAALPPGLQ